MKRVYKIILFLIMCFLIIVPLRRSIQDDNIKIDGSFQEWNDMPGLEAENYYNNQINKNLKSLKYYMDDDYLYLYVEKYYYDESWSIIINILDEDDENIEIINSVELRESKDDSSSLDIEYLNKYEDRSNKIEDKAVVSNTRVETKLSLDRIKKDLNGDNLMFEVFLGGKDNPDIEVLSDADVTINKGPVFGLKFSAVFSVIIYIIGLKYLIKGYNK